MSQTRETMKVSVKILDHNRVTLALLAVGLVKERKRKTLTPIVIGSFEKLFDQNPSYTAW